MVVAMSSPVDMFLRMRRQRGTVTALSAQACITQCRDRAEQPSTGRGEDTLCRTTAQIAAVQHVITSFKGSRQCSRVVAGLRCRLGSSYQKAPRSEPNFAKLIVSTPTKSTICDRLGYLDRARDLGTESCVAVRSKSLNSARRWTRRTRPRGGRRGPESECQFRAILRDSYSLVSVYSM